MKKIRIPADKFYEASEYYGGMMGDTMIPVDLYGKRVFGTKDEKNVQLAADDIKEFYGLEGDCGFAPETESKEE